MDIMNFTDDITLAQNAKKHAYSKKFQVGVCLQGKSGKKYTACNLEIAGEKISAEKIAFGKAITEGEKHFEYILIVAGNKNEALEKYEMDENTIKFMKELVDENFIVYKVYNNILEESSL